MAAAIRQAVALPRSGAATTTSVAFPSALLANSAIIVIAANYTGTVNASGSTNGALTAALRGGSGNNFGAIFYKEGVPAGAETITVSGGDYISGVALEVTGLLTASSLDKTGTSTATTVTASAANSQADELAIVNFVSNGGGTNINIAVPTSGYVTDDRQNDAEASTGYIGAHKIVSASETSSASMTGSNSTGQWVGLIATFKAAAGGGPVTVALTGVEGTGAPGTLTPATDKALTGNTGTGAVGTVTQSRTKALTGNAGTGAVGTVVAARDAGLTGAEGTGAVGDVTASTGSSDVSVALSGVEGTGDVGAVAPTIDTALTGATGTGAAGTVGPGATAALSGVAGAGAVGDVTPAATDVTVALTGVEGTGQVGDVAAPAPPGPPPAAGGFVMGPSPAPRPRAQERHFKPLLQRVLEAKAPRVKPAKERAAARAKAIELQAAELILENGNQARFDQLRAQWEAQRPVVPATIQQPLDALFLAQVAFRLQQMGALEALRRRQIDDEEAVLALLLA